MLAVSWTLETVADPQGWEVNLSFSLRRGRVWHCDYKQCECRYHPSFRRWPAVTSLRPVSKMLPLHIQAPLMAPQGLATLLKRCHQIAPVTKSCDKFWIRGPPQRAPVGARLWLHLVRSWIAECASHFPAGAEAMPTSKAITSWHVIVTGVHDGGV